MASDWQELVDAANEARPALSATLQAIDDKMLTPRIALGMFILLGMAVRDTTPITMEDAITALRWMWTHAESVPCGRA